VPKTHDTPIKVTADAKDLIRFGAAVFELSLGDFVEVAVADYLKRHTRETDRELSRIRGIVDAVLQKPAGG